MAFSLRLRRKGVHRSQAGERFQSSGRGLPGERSGRLKGGHRASSFCRATTRTPALPWRSWRKQLGFAPVELGKLAEGGALVHARGETWGPLIFEDLFKQEQ